MKRTKFLVLGQHPLLDLVKRHFIEVKRYECIGFDAAEPPDFLLVGGCAVQEHTLFPVFHLPAFVLGTDDMYTIRNLDGSALEKEPMREDHYTVISPLAYDAFAVASAIQNENLWLLRAAPTMLLRVFNVYGPDIEGDVVSKFMALAKRGDRYPVHQPGYQTRTFLHQEDFLSCVGSLVSKFLDGATGIFNVGSEEEISLVRLGDSIWQLTQGLTEPQSFMTKSKHPHRFWKLPDLTRTKAVAQWEPKVSLRQGLWRMSKS